MSVKAFGERFWPCPEPEFALPGIRELPALSFPLGLLLRSRMGAHFDVEDEGGGRGVVGVNAGVVVGTRSAKDDERLL